LKASGVARLRDRALYYPREIVETKNVTLGTIQRWVKEYDIIIKPKGYWHRK
jgi:hypothetical protein